jgi:GT2 family glycosyltransferase
MDANPRVGVLGVKLVGEDGTLQPSCRYFPTPWNTFLNTTGLARFFPNTKMVDDFHWDHGSVRDCDWVPGCYYLVRREVVETVGLFDPRYFLYCEEVDHCRLTRNAGWSVVFFPYTQVVHIGGESAKSDGALIHKQIPDLHVESELLYFRKHYGAAGVWGAVFLMVLGDLIVAGKGLLKGLNTARAVAAMEHASKVFRRFVATRMASRATR